MDVAAQHLSDEEAELAVADDGDAIARFYQSLLDDAAGGGEPARRKQEASEIFQARAELRAELRADESRGARLDERGILGRDVRRHEVEVDDGQRDVPVSYTHLTLPTILLV